MRIRFALHEDTNDIVKFINDNWKKNHILVLNRKLFLYEFENNTGLNFAIAKDNNRIIGLFGFLKYSADKKPDIAGSIWLALESENIPMLGLKIRDFVIRNEPHRKFVSPGAGVGTRNIYNVLNMNWHKMDHFFMLNRALSDYKVCKVNKPSFLLKEVNKTICPNSNIVIKPIQGINRILEYDFDSNITFYPFKDKEYFLKRFVDYPFFSYDIYGAFEKNKIIGICVCKISEVLNNKVYRIVDYYGDEKTLLYFARYFYNFIVENKYEYLDFICYGFDYNVLINSGFERLDIDKEDVIIPTHFCPFKRENVQIYAVSDKDKSLKVRICKADGDQDRPN